MVRAGHLITIALALATGAIASAAPRPTDGRELGLTIMGAIAQQKKEDNVALIKETKSESVRAVKVGYTVLGDYKVVEISLKYIVLEKNKNLILVYQDKSASEFLNPSRDPDPSPATRPVTALGDNYREEGFERVPGKVVMSASYRQKLISQDLPKVLMQCKADAYVKDGAIIGFALTQIDPGSIFEKSGFLDADVITSINGHRLNDLGGAIKLLNSLKQEDRIDVELLRGGKPLQISINVN